MSLTPPAPISSNYVANVDALIQVLLQNMKGVGKPILDADKKQKIFEGTLFEILEKVKFIGTGNIQSDWVETDPLSEAFILNKPILSNVALSGDYNDLLNLPTLFTTANARTSISLTTTGTSGAATYNNVTGVLNIPNYNAGITGWSVTGNTGTNPTNNFIGTTDNVDFVIRRNNQQIARFFSDGLSVGLNSGNSIGSIIVGFNAGQNATNSGYSFFAGRNAGNGATNANNSTIIGFNAGVNATNAELCTLIGREVGRTFTGNNIGSNNIIIGTNISLPNGRSNSINLGGVIYAINTHSSLGSNPLITPVVNGKVGIGIVTPDNSTVLHVNSTTAGFLPPRMTTTQRDAISLPATGLLVYDTTVNKVSVHDGTSWRYLQYE
ncbi:hypothetical protein [Leptolyngbya phage Lbo-JY46]